MLMAEPFLGDVSYHCKEGVHSLMDEDWAAYIADALRVFGSAVSTPSKPPFAR